MRAASILGALALSWLAACALPSWAEGAASRAGPQLRSAAGRLVLHQADGSVLDLSGLAGVQLTLQGGQRLRIDAVHAELDLLGQPVWLHQVSVPDGGNGWRTMCAAHSDGTREVVFIAGRQREDGLVEHDDESLAISCTGGALAKCRRFGYRPEAGATQRAAFNACIRMVRADYGGDGQPHTQDGRVIDVFDDLGVQQPELLRGQRFEAGWDTEGAVCVRHPRVLGLANLAALEQRYPRLRGRVGEVCSERFARSQGALVLNRSTPP